MDVLFIVHATAWCDKGCVARDPIQSLISTEQFDQIIEVIPSRPDVRDARYLDHPGLLIEHEGISPVQFFKVELFGEKAVFPIADEITLVGGVFNPTGGGCFNVAFDHLIRYQRRLDHPCTINIPIRATYQANKKPCPKNVDRHVYYMGQVEQLIKDLVWKMLVARVSFEFTVDDGDPIPCDQHPLVKLKIDTEIDRRNLNV